MVVIDLGKVEIVIGKLSPAPGYNVQGPTQIICKYLGINSLAIFRVLLL